jgi:hypothetical protein
MIHPKNPEATDKEARLQEAIATVLNKEHTCHSTAIAFNVPIELYTTVLKELEKHAIKLMNTTKS